jgi:flavin reductase (DIM6/NTAB) family NADH-FMN oxidoreductase RutF
LTEPTFSLDEFRETLGHYPTGVAVVTGIAADGAPIGMVVGSFTSVSLDPPLVAFLPMKSSGTFDVLRGAKSFCVNVLAADQLELCRRFAARRPDKFDGVPWRAAPGGSPVLEGVVSWVECEFEEVIEAGDHYIVVGRVTGLEVTRPSLPLLFFQGGYGRFALPSLVAPGDPELLEAIRIAERSRDSIEALAIRNGVDCSVMARVRDEIVFVLTANHSQAPNPATAGSRVPMIPPLGASFLVDSSEQEVEAWLATVPNANSAVHDRHREQLEKVRQRGYSVSLMPNDSFDRVAAMSDYSSSAGLPVHERNIRRMITSTTELYEPDLVEGGAFSLHSIGVPVESSDGPKLVVRMAGLPRDVDLPTVERMISDVRALAHQIADAPRTLDEQGSR